MPIVVKCHVVLGYGDTFEYDIGNRLHETGQKHRRKKCDKSAELRRHSNLLVDRISCRH